LNPIIGIAVKDIKTFFRERGTIFWTIAFPVLILLLFTAIFGREIPFNANIGIVNYDNSPQGISAEAISGINSTGLFTVSVFENKTEALKELNATTIRAVVTIPQDFITFDLPAPFTGIIIEESHDGVNRGLVFFEITKTKLACVPGTPDKHPLCILGIVSSSVTQVHFL